MSAVVTLAVVTSVLMWFLIWYRDALDGSAGPQGFCAVAPSGPDRISGGREPDAGPRRGQLPGWLFSEALQAPASEVHEARHP